MDPDVDMENEEGEKNEENSEDTDEDSTHDENMFDEDDGSIVNNQPRYSNNTSDYQGPEISNQVVHSRENNST